MLHFFSTSVAVFFLHTSIFPIQSFSLCHCRYLESGGDPLHAGLRSAALSGGQRQRDAHYDNGLQIHGASTHHRCMQRVSKTHTDPHRWTEYSAGAAYFMFVDV